MNAILNSLHRGWSRRLLVGGHLALSKQNQWGFTTQSLDFLNDLIRPLLSRQTLFTNLRDVRATLQTDTIDHLTSDLFVVKQTMEKRNKKGMGYLDDRTGPVYILPVPRTAAAYLAMASGRALQPMEAYVTFFNMAYQLAQEMDEVLQEEATNDDDWYNYYNRRLASVFEETFEVMRMFARLVGLDCPPLTTSTVTATPAKR
jgi:hypothetical protein